jgi:hypothetical protein
MTVVSRNLLCLMYCNCMTSPFPIFIELLDIQFVCPLKQKTIYRYAQNLWMPDNL